jgi:flagellar protein FliT
MIAMASQIEIYEEMTALSARMVEVARAGDWDNLIALERQVTALRNMLTTDEDPNANLSADDFVRKTTLIQRILDDDAEIRRFTEPWMEQVRTYLGSGAKRKQVARAYGSV